MNPRPSLYDPAFVKDLFDEMAGTYGLVNLISSFGFTLIWRRQCARAIPFQPGDLVCDLNDGDGRTRPRPAPTDRQFRHGQGHRHLDRDVRAGSSPRHEGQAGRVRGHRGRRPDPGPSRRIGRRRGLDFRPQDLLRGPDPHPGRPDLQAPQAGRAGLVPGDLGAAVVPFAVFYLFYLRQIIPIIGALALGNPDNYRLLGVYTTAFGNCSQACEAFKQAGLEVRMVSYFFGCATGIVGRKPIAPSDGE